MHALAIVSLLVVGFAGVWLGLVEDVEMGFVVAIACWASATLMTFSGKPGAIAPPSPKKAPAPSVRKQVSLQPREMALPAAVVGGLVVGFVGIWLGLVQDIEIAMLVGVAISAGAVLATFKGRADIWRSETPPPNPPSHQ